jgi:broad specificity phosphatase PhoE
MRIATFIRHGESTGNAGFATRDLSQIGLTEKGWHQAEELARSWAERPTRIIVSPYVRARLTAQPTIDRFPGVPVEQWPVHEFTYLEPSRWNGTSRKSRLSAIEAYWQAADPEYQDGPGAESFAKLLRRVENALNRLANGSDCGNVLVFTHGQFMQAVRLTLCFPEATDCDKMRRFVALDREYPIGNCSVYQAASAETPVLRALSPPLRGF